MRPNPAGAKTAGVVAAAPARNAAHSHTGQIGATVCLRRPIAVAPSAATSTSAISPRTRSISTTVVASVFEFARRAVSRMRMTSPPMLLGRKLLKKSGDEERRQRRAEGHVDVLRLQQQIPAPGAGERRDPEDGQRDQQPRQRRQPRGLPELRRIGFREEHDEKNDADRELDRQDAVAARAGRFVWGLGHSAKGMRHCTIDFVRKSSEPCAF